jgi:hypothetical protein
MRPDVPCEVGGEPQTHNQISSARYTCSGWPLSTVCRPPKGGAEGASKTLVTDYRFAGPGSATRKPVGWGEPQTPLTSRHREATA